MTVDDLARRPIGDHIALQCDHVQNSDHGQLGGITLCVFGSRILAVVGGDRIHDGAGLLEGYVEEIPDELGPFWASALRQQIATDRRYYDFYLLRGSYGDDTPEAAAEEPGRSDVVTARFMPRPAPRSVARAGAKRMREAVIRALAVAAGLATLAGWFVWIRLWQHRRRVAAWILPP